MVRRSSGRQSIERGSLSDPVTVTSQDRAIFKQRAAEFAVSFVRSGMVVGLGSGTTAIFAIRKIGALLKSGQLTEISGLPTSEGVAEEARRVGVPIVSFENPPSPDLTIDGADEVDADFNLIKGGGGALLREKIVAQNSRREIIVVDESKISPCLGTHWPVPVEVIPFACGSQQRYLESLGSQVQLRKKSDGTVFRTDQGNLILDAHFGPIPDLRELVGRLECRAGIVEHGIFLSLTSDLIVASQRGVEHRTRPTKP